MKERLLNILDQSTCLTRRQMKDYLAGTMMPEEIHAAETHIASCPLCSMALDGFEANSEEALAAIASLNSGFLKDHFDSITPQIHLNSMAPAVPVAHHVHHTKKKKTPAYSLMKIAAVAAALAIGFGVFWVMDQRGHNATNPPVIAQNVAVPPAPAAPQTIEGNGVAARREETKAVPVKPVVSGDAVNDKYIAVKDAGAAPATESVPAAAPRLSVTPATVAARPVDADKKLQKGTSGALSWADGDSALITKSYTAKSGSNMALGGARSTGTQYVVDGVVTTPPAARYTQSQMSTPQSDKFEDRSEASGYSYNLKKDYKSSMNRSDEAVRKRLTDTTMYSAAAVTKAKKEAAKSREKEVIKKAKEPAPEAETDEHPLAKGDELYGKGNYKAALSRYNTAIKSGNRRQRAEATLMAAKCYRNIGNKAKAISLLQGMVDNGGPQKRAAKRMLDELKEK